LHLKEGDVITASDETGRTVMFPSTGGEAWDVEIAQRNGIKTPRFMYAESWLRFHYNDGLMNPYKIPIIMIFPQVECFLKYRIAPASLKTIPIPESDSLRARLCLNIHHLFPG